MIHHSEGAPPPGLPAGYVGPAVLPGTGRLIFWTGRVAIGLRHGASPHRVLPEAQRWIQELLLSKEPA